MEKTFAHRMRSVWRAENGSATIESVLIFPVLLVTWVLMMMLFDYLYESNSNQSAANTIADIVSRQTDEITPQWIENSGKLTAFLSNRSERVTGVRITVLDYKINNPASASYKPDRPKRYYKVRFSVFRGGSAIKPADSTDEFRYRDEDFKDIQTSPFGTMLPHVGYGNSLIIVETYRSYKNDYIFFLEDKLYGRAMSIPRYASTVILER